MARNDKHDPKETGKAMERADRASQRHKNNQEAVEKAFGKKSPPPEDGGWGRRRRR